MNPYRVCVQKHRGSRVVLRGGSRGMDVFGLPVASVAYCLSFMGQRLTFAAEFATPAPSSRSRMNSVQSPNALSRGEMLFSLRPFLNMKPNECTASRDLLFLNRNHEDGTHRLRPERQNGSGHP